MQRRNGFRILSAVASALLAIPLAAAAETSTHTIVTGDYRLEQADNGKHSIIMTDKGYSYIQSPGNPSLPQKIIDITVPVELDLSDLTMSIDNVKSTTLDETYELAAMPPLYSDSVKDWGGNSNIVDGKNIDIYGKNESYPQEYAKLLPYTILKERDTASKDRALRKVKRIRIVFSPFQYNPVTGKLVLVNEATVTLRYNNQVNKNFAPVPKVAGSGPLAIEDYVIITTNAIVENSNYLAHFITMKERQGHTVRVVTETDYDGLTGQAPNGRAEKIRKWLQDNEPVLNIDYVLLIGNPDPDDPLDASDAVGDVPMKMCYPRFYEPTYRESPTDWFYADLIGNWDVNGDGIFGVDVSSTQPTSPNPAIDPTTFSVRWTGEIQFDFAEQYTIRSFSDDGTRVWINGNLIIDNWTDHLPTSNTGSVNLGAGRYPITVEYYQNAGHAVMKLEWNSANVERNPIPSTRLYHWDAGTASYIAGGLDVTYYNNMDLTGTTVTGVNNVWEIWSTGDNAANGRKTASQVAVGRIPVYSNNYADLDAILEKTIRYESDDPAAIAWRESILLPMRELWDNTPNYKLGEGVRTDIAIPNGFTSFRIYDDDFSTLPTPGPTPELWPCNVNNVESNWINTPDSRGMVTWYTHGWETGASDVSNSNRATNLNNTKPSFTFQGSCLNGHPETSNNLGYALLLNGAVATVSASRVSWGGDGMPNQPNSPSLPCIAYAYTRHVIDAGLSAGEALSAYKADLTTVNMNTMDFNLYGDPDCYLRTVFHNQPPTATVGGPYSVNQGGTITIDASGSSDPEGDVLQYRWDLYNDGSYEIPWTSSPTYSIEMCEPASFQVKVQVKDAIGLTSTATAQLTFLNVDPSVNAGTNQTVPEGADVNFSGSFSDPGLSCESYGYTWDFGDLSNVTGTLTPVHPYGDNGVYNANLIVTDNFGGTGSDAVTITVNNVAPSVTIDAVTPAPASILVGQTVTFDGSFSDPGWLDSHTSVWNFGDGTTASGTLTEENLWPNATGTCQTAKVFSTPGVYTVTLTVTDDDEVSGTATIPVTVYGFNFGVTSNPVPPNTPVTINYTIPPMYNGATVCVIEHHTWYTLRRTEFNQVPLSGSAGDHSYSPIWYWNKWYFGTNSGPYLIELEVNGVIMDSFNLYFSY